MCINPDCDNEAVFSRGLCSGCYTRRRRNGTLERKNLRNTGMCSELGCGKPAFAKNFCMKHYDANRHPLVTPWKLLRSRSPGQYPAAWDNFDAFLADVGDRPSSKHQLRRINPEKPYEIGNFHWLEPIEVTDYYSPEQRWAYERTWGFKRKFGITVEDYDRILAAQGGGCGVCGNLETHTYKSGKLKDLAVDHDHQTGTVRGILCFNCNQGIGRLKDDPKRLRAAADYLERHAPKLACDAPVYQHVAYGLTSDGKLGPIPPGLTEAGLSDEERAP